MPALPRKRILQKDCCSDMKEIMEKPIIHLTKENHFIEPLCVPINF